jgi:GH15 family glucan-1,4-alpha-glucosidase
VLDRPVHPPIGDHALLADCHSAALVARDGTVDWACMRRFDRPSVFASLLDHERGGHLALRARGETSRQWCYVDDSLVLETTVTTDGGRLRVRDGFAMREGGREDPEHLLLRVVDVLDGEVELDVEVAPRFDYGALQPWLRSQGRGTWTATGGEEALVIATDLDLEADGDRGTVGGTTRLGAGERRRLALRSSLAHLVDPSSTRVGDVDDMLEGTIAWWRDWSDRSETPGPNGSSIRRSAVVLKGLTCAPTGAVIAAPTTSLPEQVGGERNWDYRYSWVRDATLTIEALALVGHTEVSRGFRDFLLRSTAGNAEQLQIMYGCYGARRLPELELDLAGYRDSRPVRIGNGAADQVQLDVFGHVLDATHVWHAHAEEPLDDDEWLFLRQVVEAAIDHWRDPDRGMWEMRCEARHFVESKVMCWVALDRGIRLAEENDLDADLERWRAVREQIRRTVLTEGVDASRSHFVQSFGVDRVDASLLRLALVGFVDADDPLMLGTVDAVREQLAVGEDGAFLLRYLTDDAPDGLEGGEGAFLLCSFWLVEVLALQGEVDEAQQLFEQLCAMSNDLGLFSEEVDVQTRASLGNFPQAFTHLGVIRSAFRIAEARGGA